MLGNMLTRKEFMRTQSAHNNMDPIDKIFFVLHHLLSNINITSYFNYKPWFYGVFSRDNLPRIKDGAYVININDNKSKGAQWVSLIFDRNTAMYFDFFLKSNIFLNVYQTKSKINQSLATYLE